ncbi:MAG: glycosyltransferase [Treponema sp.]|nr:glycosyltransferase [Treponema sp.]
MAKMRINVVGVPVDIFAQEDLADEIVKMEQKKGTKQICFVTIWDILKARRNKEFMACLKNADLILPTSKSIVKGAKFLKLPEPVRYNPFPTIIQILATLEKHYKSLYLLGGRKDTLMTAERNLRATFPGLQIVGRYVGYYPKNIETDIISAIYKASPSLTLISNGIHAGNCWAYRRRKQFSSSIMLYDKDIFKIFAKQKKRVSQETFEKGLEIWQKILKNPIKIFLIFPYIWYKILLIFFRIFRKKSTNIIS